MSTEAPKEEIPKEDQVLVLKLRIDIARCELVDAQDALRALECDKPTATRTSLKVSKGQLRVWRYIAGVIDKTGYPPTLREMGRDLHMMSTNGPASFLRILERKGIIALRKMHARGIQLLVRPPAEGALIEAPKAQATPAAPEATVTASELRAVGICPGPDCPMCSGEACDLCGAGCWSSVRDCEHDILDRHKTADPKEALPMTKPTPVLSKGAACFQCHRPIYQRPEGRGSRSIITAEECGGHETAGCRAHARTYQAAYQEGYAAGSKAPKGGDTQG